MVHPKVVGDLDASIDGPQEGAHDEEGVCDKDSGLRWYAAKGNLQQYDHDCVCGHGYKGPDNVVQGAPLLT